MSFKPKTKEELETAITEWISDKTTAESNYGNIDDDSIRIDDNLFFINKILCLKLNNETLPFPMSHEIMIKDEIPLDQSIVKIIITKKDQKKFKKFNIETIVI